MNVLYLYNASQTYTNTVFEHLSCLKKYSEFRTFFCHQDLLRGLKADLSIFDAVVIHYTIRLPFDQIADSTADLLEKYHGLKALFIQDEYDHPHKAWFWIKKLGIRLVFTVVPFSNIDRVYPAKEFPNVRFVSNLTGYAPEERFTTENFVPPSERDLIFGYRARPLPVQYGQLGRDKVDIGRLVKKYCDYYGISNDIAWTEESRLYGPKWDKFLLSCRAMLGSESGSNVFDWDGTLFPEIENFKKKNPTAKDEDIYDEIIRSRELPGLMNQISPRIFEAIAARTVLVLFEGEYSGVVSPGVHFIPLKKDGSNLNDVVQSLKDKKYIDELTDRAYREILGSGIYSYNFFVKMVDEELRQSIKSIEGDQINVNFGKEYLSSSESSGMTSEFTTEPIRSGPPSTLFFCSFSGRCLCAKFVECAFLVWKWIPQNVKDILRPRLKFFFNKG